MMALAGETDVMVVGRAESSSRPGNRDQLGSGDCFVTVEAWALRAKALHNNRQTMRVKITGDHCSQTGIDLARHVVRLLTTKVTTISGDR
jgi:hypothetical protein